MPFRKIGLCKRRALWRAALSWYNPNRDRLRVRAVDLDMVEDFGQNWGAMLHRCNCRFVWHYIDNNRSLRIEEKGDWHSLSWAETCFQDFWTWPIFGQWHHIRTFISRLEKSNPTFVTRYNICPLATNYHPFLLLFCCQVVRDPSGTLFIPLQGLRR